MRRRPVIPTKLSQSPLKDAVNHARVVNTVDRSYAKQTASKPSNKSGVHLPDVTGLTSAVQSPAKLGVGYFLYDGKEDGELEGVLSLVHNISVSQYAFQLALWRH